MVMPLNNDDALSTFEQVFDAAGAYHNDTTAA
jgi:hypothetical protein